jgi:hypothetical protein
MSSKVFTGYLVIGDISGYTSYVASTELEHSQAVLSELLELIVNRFQPLLNLVKLEGDAVFAHAPGEQITRGESLMELLEMTYVAFRDRVMGIVRHTTCECKACRAIPTLDLKFMVHFGEYFIQSVSGINELVGSDVNLLHRLTKNHVAEETGWHAYAMFTEACLTNAGVSPDGMHEQLEKYEHLGEVKTFNLDLRARYKEISEARRVFLEPEEAHGTFAIDLAVPPAVAWEWLSDPRRRNQVSGNDVWSAISRPGGRSGVGASNHCAHGKDAYSCETVLDWRPFEYFTVQGEGSRYPDKLFNSMTTYHLEAQEGDRGTRLHLNMRLEHPVSKLLFRPFLPFFFKKLSEDWLEPMERSILSQRESLEPTPSEPLGEVQLQPALDGD